ncbi:MAG: hypothetical protein JNK67_20540 [Alphaproteobacteria bacterium]|nr:hypothetical protein [Alphaproteobacteria bacterium]
MSVAAGRDVAPAGSIFARHDPALLREPAGSLAPAAAVAMPGAVPSCPVRIAAGGHGEGQRRHLAWEEAILICILHRRTTVDDVGERDRRAAPRRDDRRGSVSRALRGVRLP